VLDRRRLRGRRCDQWILLVGTRAPPSHKVVRVDVGLGRRVLFRCRRTHRKLGKKIVGTSLEPMTLNLRATLSWKAQCDVDNPTTCFVPH
jgi:hypothetical protein